MTVEKGRIGSVVAVAALLALVAIIHGGSVDDWWLNDDPQVLLQALRFSPFGILFSPAQWQTLSASNFTPLVTLSFQLDLALAGLHPLLFHIHQLVIIAGCALLLFAFIRSFGGPTAAFLASACFVVAPATIYAARTLMIRHYVEGLALSLAVMLLWQRGGTGESDRRSRLFVGLSALFYLLALLAKEVFIPLPLLLIGLDRMNDLRWSRVVKRLLPMAGVGLVYLLWRTWMLGSAGGYQPTGLSLGQIGVLPAHLISRILGPIPWMAGLIWVITVGLIVGMGLALFPKRTALIVMVALLAATVPLVPVVSILEVRHAFVPTAILFGLVGLTAALIRTAPGVPLVSLGLLLLVVWASGVGELRQLRAETSIMQAEGRYIWEKSPEDAPLLAGSPEWYLDGLADLRQLETGGQAPRFFGSTEGLLLGETDPADVVIVASGGGEYRPLPAEVIQQLRMEKAQYAPAAPLGLEIRREGNQLRWQFGPACDCRWTFLTVPHYDEFVVPIAGVQRVPRPVESQQFRIRRDLPDGRWTISPALTMPAEGRVVEWKRSG